MKTSKHIGLIVFLSAFFVLLLTLFVGKYRIGFDSINQTSMTEEQKVAFHISFDEINKDTIHTKFELIRLINESFQKANKLISETYGITELEVRSIVNASIHEGQVLYILDQLDNIFDSSNRLSAIKKKGVIDYTAWIAEKSYEDEAGFIEDLESSIEKYNDAILVDRGFDKSKVKQFSIQLLQHSLTGIISNYKILLFVYIYIIGSLGALVFIIADRIRKKAAIQNNRIYHYSLTNRGWMGIVLGAFLISFYIVLYWFPLQISEWVAITDPLSELLSGRPASQWFLYGWLYTLAVLVMGIRFLLKYKQNNYQLFRTYTVMFFQLTTAFLLPQILYTLNAPEVDIKNIWPLDYYFFFEWRLRSYLESGTLGLFLFGWGLALIIIAVPIITYYFGKRWYCSWVCGCGGLAETVGDPFRQLSDKRLIVWKVERYLIHGVLVFAVLMTLLVLYTYFTASSSFLGINSFTLREVYGFLIGSVFAGVIGTGFYPLMGNRVWCRFGCPLAAYLGMIQRFKSRFRITTNGGQCISCGNCSTYCEMGIDVRWYAQRGQNIVRSSCVGCGICSAVCPRGVLKLENRNEKGRINIPISTVEYVQGDKGK